jgi:iron complex transport system permease protein
MKWKNRDVYFYTFLLVTLVLASVGHLFSGVIPITFENYSDALWDFDPQSTPQLIAREFRIPRLVISMLAGSALAVSGMLMQTLFNNPLAGPYVLGINSGSSLFVAFSLFSGFSIFSSDLGIVASALLGAFVFGSILLGFSMHTKSQVSLLLIGLMLGSFTTAIITVLQSTTQAEELKAFTIWTMGSLQHVQFEQLPLLLLIFSGALLLCLLLIKPMNVLILGEKTTELLGFNIRKIRLLTITITAIFTGLITAYCGPIAFVGLAVPNITRMLFRTQSHGKLLVANLVNGALFLVLSDIIIQLVEPIVTIPINAFTSLIGAPILMLIVLKRIR